MEEAGITDVTSKINVHTDSSAAKSLVSHTGPGRKSRHIQMIYVYLQDLIQDGQAKVLKVGTHDNTAYLMTKYLTGEVTRKFSIMLGMHPVAEDYHL